MAIDNGSAERYIDCMVILYPNSITNRTKDYVVVDYYEWLRFSDGTTKSLIVKGRFKTYQEAANHQT